MLSRSQMMQYLLPLPHIICCPGMIELLQEKRLHLETLRREEELRDLMDETSLSECNCPVEEYINGEDDIPICIHYDGDSEDRLFAELGTSQANSEYLAQDDSKEEEQLFGSSSSYERLTTERNWSQ